MSSSWRLRCAAPRGEGIDLPACRELAAAKVKARGKENRRDEDVRVAARALSSAFVHLVEEPAWEILAALATFVPLGDEESRRRIASSTALLDDLVSILSSRSRGKGKAARTAALVLREIAAALSDANGIYGALVKVLRRKPVSRTACCLAVHAGQAAASCLVELGMVQLLVEVLLVDAESPITTWGPWRRPASCSASSRHRKASACMETVDFNFGGGGRDTCEG
ncbi:hypothetical protein HU200_039858 [Digitaria exilis]|uniref:Uncharacterized protein n=1 Tax=Digitaria exilis TaxID=1010633 RepID=A0A835BBM9_9POAL|nr:hypothetical protein HU200_039858 [Digitaria exilis]